MIPDPQSEFQPKPAQQSSGCLTLTLAIITGLWVAGVLFASLAGEWVMELTRFTSSLPYTDWRWAVHLICGMLIWLPLLILNIAGPNHQRPMYRSWRMAADVFVLMTPARLFAQTDSQGVAIYQIVILVFYLAGVYWFAGRKSALVQLQHLREWPRGVVVVAGIGALLWMPWVLLGALGSLLDAALGGLTALLGGLTAAWILQLGFYSVRGPARGRWLALPLALALLACGLGLNGNEWLLIYIFPVLGWVAAAVWSWAKDEAPAWPAAALLFTIGLSAPLIWVDADELLASVSGTGEATFFAATGEIFIALVAAALIGAAWHWLPNVARFTAGLAVAAGFAWLWTGGIFLVGGQPGFYGEQLFVIMKDQADLSAAAKIADYPQRRAAVYRQSVDLATQGQAGLQQDLRTFGIGYKPYYLVNALEVDGGPLVRLWLSLRPDVDRILDSPHLRPVRELPADPKKENLEKPASPQWDLTMIRANLVWGQYEITGHGVVIGQSDSGVDGTHAELADQYRGASSGNDYNWFDPWFHTAAPTDQGGHGTHTLGSILGKNVGVAPDAKWIGCVNLGRNLGNPAVYLDCMQFMLAPFPQAGDPFRDGKPEMGANILNNSWGCPVVEGCDAGTYLQAVKALKTAGIFVVASAGNEGTNGCSTLADPLAIYADVYTVGAVNKQGERASFSSLGPVTVDGSGRQKPDLMAPGEDVVSAFPGNSYASLSGTSMAGPHVVGVVALMWSANPKLIGNIERTREILDQSAQPYKGKTEVCGESVSIPNNTSGYGVVDALAAVQMALGEK